MGLKTQKIFLFFLFFILISTFLPVQASPELIITVTTDKEAYYSGRIVQIHGNLTKDGSPVNDGLVALQVRDPGQTFILRTLSTGTIPPIAWLIKIWDLFPSDSMGQPRSSPFSRGELAFFTVTVKNIDVEPHIVLLTINIYDSNNASLSAGSIQLYSENRTTLPQTIGVEIPTWAAIGNATAYANAYTDWPRVGGTPYCPEVSAGFVITGGSQATTPTTKTQPTTLQANGTYSLSFKLAPDAPHGDYTIYVTTSYQGQTAFNSATFKVRALGDIDDDGDVDSDDFFLFREAYTGEYNPEADLNNDGTIDSDDFFLFRDAYVG